MGINQVVMVVDTSKRPLFYAVAASVCVVMGLIWAAV